MTDERLRPFQFTIGEHVRVCGTPGTVRARLRTHAGRAMYQITLAGEHFTRTIMEDGVEATAAMKVAA